MIWRALKTACAVLSCLGLMSTAAAGPRSVFIEELTSPEVRQAIASGYDKAIYYAGSTEQNGPHMVLGKHNYVARYVAERIAKTLGNTLVYPIMPFAPTGDLAPPSGHMRFAGSVSVSASTYAALAREVAHSAKAAGFRYIFIMGDHGGGQDALQAVAAELDAPSAASGVRVFYVGDLYFETDKQIAAELAAMGVTGELHAGIQDSAELMAIDTGKRWVRRDQLAGASKADGVSGDPAKASVALGKRFVRIKVDKALAQMRRQLGLAAALH